ncbi:aromatic hydrocarbon degradation protein [Paraflavisolibacter sp. H34]|uniref:OmpP1/FadL family transporter n=1 Tax=Huijunlia imazamoxiresistens TaxID=3127457 RepID=UPI003016568A
MKKIFLLLGTGFISTFLYAQEPADALRFSWTVPGGTARQQAVGGAMGALGGDITSAFTNPAGLAVYRTGDLIFSPILQFGSTRASYRGRTESAEYNKFNWGATGFVFGSDNPGGKVKNTSFGLAYNRMADFNSNILYRGFNNQSSYAQKFIEDIGSNKDPNSVAQDYPYGASLAFNTYWIDTIRGASGQVTGFQSRAPYASGLYQQQVLKTSGGVSEFALGGAVNLNDKVMLGATLGVPVLRYERESAFTEQDTSTRLNKFDRATITENLTTKGVGLNLRLGAIFRPSEAWRLGLSFHTPTLYGLTDNVHYTVSTDPEDSSGQVYTQESSFLTNDAPAQFRYSFNTPYRFIGSVAYVMGSVEDVSSQRGFITADLEYVNYKVPAFHEENETGLDTETADYLKSVNQAVDNAYKGAFNFRLGAELKFNTFMVRGGAAYYGNPYKDIQGEKGSKLNLSGGLGYRNKGFFMDLTYVHALTRDVHFPYRLESAPYSGASLRTATGSLLTTFGFKF